MSKKHILFKLLSSTVLLALLVSPLSAGAAPARAPAALPNQPQTPPPEKAIRFAPPGAASPDAAPPVVGPAEPAPAEPLTIEMCQEPQAPQAPDACGNPPSPVSFGQDLEMLLGPQENYATYRLDQTPTWGSTSQITMQPSETPTPTVKSSGCTYTKDQIVIYKDPYGTTNTQCATLSPGKFANSSAFKLSNDSITSIKVGANVKVTVYEDADYGGRSWSTESDAPDLRNVVIDGWDFNDEISSIKVAWAPKAYGVAAVALGGGAVNALMKTDSSSGELMSQTWTGDAGWGAPVRLGLSAAGNPVALARGLEVVYFVRSGANIKYNQTNLGVFVGWNNVDGVSDAASDPVVIMPDMYHMKLFYRTSSGHVKFTEWESGVGWRTTPLDLGAPSGTTMASELGAVARDEKNFAVFGVSANNKLWVKAWSQDKNQSDWSDATWLELASSIKITKPAVASRSAGHMGVAISNTSNSIVYKEWTYAAGWKALANIGGYVEPLGLAAAAGDEMFLYGVNSSGNMYTRQWTMSNGWAAWVLQEGGWATSQYVAAVALRPHDLMLFGSNASNKFVTRRYTAEGRVLIPSATTNPGYGGLRGQAVATVRGRTAWVSAYRNSSSQWVLEARDTATWSGASVTLDNPTSTTDSNKVDVAVGDVNLDGNDEVILATVNDAGSSTRLSIHQLTYNGAAVSGISRVTYTDVSGSGYDVQVSVGDLNGDAIENDVALAWLSGPIVYVNLYKYASNSLAYKTQMLVPAQVSTQTDLEMAMGRLAGGAGEQIVLATCGQTGVFLRADVTRLVYASAINTFAVLGVAGDMIPYAFGSVGSYSTALGVGDVDGDMLDEVIYTYSNNVRFYNIPEGTSSGSSFPLNTPRSLAVGDVDADGRAEVLVSAGNRTHLFKVPRPEAARPDLRPVGQAQPGVPLLADLDGDSYLATFKRCDEVMDVRVLGVINSAPVWYQDGVAVQSTGGGMANTSGVTNGATDGWTASFGGSFSVGFEHEFEVPVTGIKIGEVRASVTKEFIGSIGHETDRETSTTESNGVYFGDDGFGIGAVCYTQTSYQCYTFVMSRLNSTITSTMQTCLPQPPTEALKAQVCKSLENWQKASFKNAAGASWAPIGHRPPNTTTISVDVGWPDNYPVLSAPPVDPFRIWWQKKDSIRVEDDVNPQSVPQTWSIATTVATSTISSGSFEENTEVSAGVTMMDLTLDASVSVGYSDEWSSSSGWETGLEFNGDVFHYPDTGCSVCKPYNIVPYVYKAQARTLAGVTYQYLEQDYFVKWMSQGAQADAAPHQPRSIVGVVPQAPVITSTTHPDPAAWYPTDTAVLNWGQPAGDPAAVIRYEWNLDQAPVSTPTAQGQLAATDTFENLADGVYYLHIRAVGDGGDRSPITHRAVRVDQNAPQVSFVANPFAPNGLDGWYNTPVAVSVAAADTDGSGVAGVEYSTDGAAWQPYSAPIPITADTPGDTLWARATDNLGHTSEPVTTTVKLDQTQPSTYDSDGYGLSYASIVTDEVGNAQLVMGGALSDTLSGRLQVEVKAGDTGAWRTVSAVGDLPVPPGNLFSTTMPSLQWIYTPTFDVRGVYPLWVRGIDAAGNYETAWMHGAFWWEPDDVPVLVESQVSVSPRQVYPGDVAAFTIGARNSGYQEAQLLVTNTLPAGLTLVPESISDGGQYNANTRIITWTLDALWPGQMRYLFFNAVADSAAATSTLENQVDLMGYWPWDPLFGVPNEPAHHYYSTTTTLAVLPNAAQASAAAGASRSSAPRVLGAAVAEGHVVDDPQVTLLVNASPDASFLYVKEWTWNADLNGWELAAESGWAPFQAGSGLELTQDASGKYGRYTWTLSEGDGVKYLGVWVADAHGQVSNLNEGNLVYTNLLSVGGQQLAAGQRVQYRVSLHANDLAILNLVSLSGDADLYVWKPRAGFKPNYYSNGLTSGSLWLDTIAFFAPEDGMYVIEVQAATDAYYRLVTSGALSGAGLLAETRVNPALASLTENDVARLKAQDEVLLQAQGEALQDAHQALASLHSTHLSLAEKDRPAHPLTLSTPYNRYDAETLPPVSEAPPTPVTYQVYLPLMTK